PGLVRAVLSQTELSARAEKLRSYVGRVNRHRGGCAREALHGVLKVAGAHDVVTVEHAARPMSGDLHRNAFRNACVHQGSHCRTPEVVTEGPQHAAPLHAVAHALRKSRRGAPARLFPLPPWGSGAGIMRPSQRCSDSTRSIWAVNIDLSSGVRYTSRPSSF